MCISLRPAWTFSDSDYTSLSRFPFSTYSHSSARPDFDVINRAMVGRGSETKSLLEKRAESQEGIRKYYTGEDLLFANDSLVGILRQKREDGQREARKAVETLMELEGIDAFTMRADAHSYCAIFRNETTVLQIQYSGHNQEYVLERYCHNLKAPAQRRVERMEEMQPVLRGYDERSTTTIGILIYEGENLRLKLHHQRKKPTIATSPTIKEYSSFTAAEDDLLSHLSYFSTSFPSTSERTALAANGEAQFTILFTIQKAGEGYTALPTGNAFLESTARRAITTGIVQILKNFTEIYNNDRKSDTSPQILGNISPTDNSVSRLSPEEIAEFMHFAQQ